MNLQHQTTLQNKAASGISPKPFFRPNISWILEADSYKHSHKPQYAPDVSRLMAYGSARSSAIKSIKSTQFFGLQAVIQDKLMKPITHADIDYAKERIRLHGNGKIFFAEEDFRKVVDVYKGFPPIRICAIKEGTNIAIGEIQYTIECDDPDLFWMVQFFETVILRGVWYPTTVSTISKECKRIIYKYLEQTCDDPDNEILFKLHDFGARGVSSGESAQLGGMAHLINFLGSDTMECLEAAKYLYGEEMAGYSINASEHATITSWRREFEFKAYENMLNVFGGPGNMFACVSDSYNIFEHGWGEVLLQKVVDSGSLLVIRPDSGDPISTVLRVVKILSEKFGYTMNKKGFKVLKNVRVIQGDGVNLDSIESILCALTINGFSTENVAFGMGGALLQKCDRDTFGYAQKVCAAYSTADNDWFDIYKDPVNGGKTSKRGRLTLVEGTASKYHKGEVIEVPAHITCRESELNGRKVLLELVYDYGFLERYQTFAEIREIANTYQ